MRPSRHVQADTRTNPAARIGAWSLCEALERAKDEGLAYVILDGKVIPCDQCKEPAVGVKGQVIDLWYSGRAHGGNIQAVLAPGRFPLWVSPAEPG